MSDISSFETNYLCDKGSLKCIVVRVTIAKGNHGHTSRSTVALCFVITHVIF